MHIYLVMFYNEYGFWMIGGAYKSEEDAHAEAMQRKPEELAYVIKRTVQ